MSASIIGSDARNGGITNYAGLKRSSGLHVNELASNSRNAALSNGIVRARKPEHYPKNTYLINAASCGETNGAWYSATNHCRSTGKNRESVFRIINILALQIAKRDGEVEALRERSAEQDKVIRKLSRSHLEIRYTLMKFAKNYMAEYPQEGVPIFSEQLESFRKTETEVLFRPYFSKELGELSYHNVFPSGHDSLNLVKPQPKDSKPISQNFAQQSPSTSAYQSELARYASKGSAVAQDSRPIIRTESNSVMVNGPAKKCLRGSSSQQNLLPNRVPNNQLTSQNDSKLEQRPSVSRNDFPRLRPNEGHTFPRPSSVNNIVDKALSTKIRSVRKPSLDKPIDAKQRSDVSVPVFSDGAHEQHMKGTTSFTEQPSFRPNKIGALPAATLGGRPGVIARPQVTANQPAVRPSNTAIEPKNLNTSIVSSINHFGSGEAVLQNGYANQNGVASHPPNSFKRYSVGSESCTASKFPRVDPMREVITLSSDEES